MNQRIRKGIGTVLRYALFPVLMITLCLGACSRPPSRSAELPPHLDRPIFNEAFTEGYTVTLGGTSYRFRTEVMGEIALSSGKLVACDPIVDCKLPFAKTVPRGRFPVHLAIASTGAGDQIDQRVAIAKIVFAPGQIASWEMARFEGDDGREIAADQYVGYGVDSATGGFTDLNAAKAHQARIELGSAAYIDQFVSAIQQGMEKTLLHYMHSTDQGEIAMFMSGYGDGSYASYWGYDKDGKLLAVLTDFRVVLWVPKSRP